MAWGISFIYNINSRRPKIDPWGTPQEILDKSEKWLFNVTLSAWSYKCDLNYATD